VLKLQRNPQYKFWRTSVRWNPTYGRTDMTKLTVALSKCSAIVPNFHITQHRLTHHKSVSNEIQYLRHRYSHHTVCVGRYVDSKKRYVDSKTHTHTHTHTPRSVVGRHISQQPYRPQRVSSGSDFNNTSPPNTPTLFTRTWTTSNSTSCPMVSIYTVLHVGRYPWLTTIMCRRKWPKAMLFLIT
jgi:hypothetical protein